MNAELRDRMRSLKCGHVSNMAFIFLNFCKLECTGTGPTQVLRNLEKIIATIREDIYIFRMSKSSEYPPIIDKIISD